MKSDDDHLRSGLEIAANDDFLDRVHAFHERSLTLARTLSSDPFFETAPGVEAAATAALRDLQHLRNEHAVQEKAMKTMAAAFEGRDAAQKAAGIDVRAAWRAALKASASKWGQGSFFYLKTTL